MADTKKGMIQEEQTKYADLIMSMSLDFKMGKISWDLYKSNLKLISDKLEKYGN